jgi:hypothetical protein
MAGRSARSGEAARVPGGFLYHPQLDIGNANPAWKVHYSMPVRSGRLEKRRKLGVPVEVSSLQHPSEAEKTTTENVSSLGMRVLIDRAKQLNERLIIRSLAGDLRTVGRVVYCQQLPGGRYGVGLQFLGVAVDWPKDLIPGAAD